MSTAPSPVLTQEASTNTGPADPGELLASSDRLELVHALDQRSTRAEALMALAVQPDALSRAAVLATIPQLTWDECHEVVATLRAAFEEGEAGDLVDALLESKRKGPKALIRDLLSLLRDPVAADRALDEEAVLIELGAAVFARSVRGRHLLRLQDLARSSHRFRRSMAVHGLGGLLAFEQLQVPAREAVQAMLTAVANGDRSKPVRAQAAGTLSSDLKTLQEAYGPDMLGPLGGSQAPSSPPESDAAPLSEPGPHPQWAKVPPAPNVPINFHQYSVYSEHFLLALAPQDDDDRRVRDSIIGTVQTPGGILVLKVTPEEIESADLRPWLTMIEFLAREGWLLAARGRLSYVLEGYEDDARELFDIPQARSYLAQLWGPLPWLAAWVGPNPGWGLHLVGAIGGLDGAGGDARLNEKGAGAILHAVNHAFALTVRLGEPNPRAGHDLLQLVGLENEDPATLFTGVDVVALAETMSDCGVVSTS